MGFWGEGPFKSGSSEGNRDFYRMTEKGRKAKARYDKRTELQAKNDKYPTGIGCGLLILAAGGGLTALAAALYGVAHATGIV